MKNKKGISLIVLVITIIIIIILAGAVILNLADNNPIDNAEKSKIMSDLDTFSSDLTVQIGQKYIENIITAEMIKNSPEIYIGKEVTYTGYSESINDITWRIFNVTDDGIIQLITDSYVDLTYKGIAPLANIVVNGYSISSSDNRDTLINYLNTSTNWSEYEVSGKTVAKGAATLEEFCSSYKLKYPGKYLECVTTTAGDTTYITAGATADGYVLRFNEASVTDAWEYYKNIGTTDTFYIKIGTSYGSNTIYAYWLASPSANASSRVMLIDSRGYVYYYNYSNAYGGVCPLVSLTSAVLVENASGEIEVK